MFVNSVDDLAEEFDHLLTVFFLAIFGRLAEKYADFTRLLVVAAIVDGGLQLPVDADPFYGDHAQSSAQGNPIRFAEFGDEKDPADVLDPLVDKALKMLAVESAA